jgi:hypothetical protein
MFIIPTPRTTTMNSSYVDTPSKAPGANNSHLSFYDVQRQIDDDSPWIDETLLCVAFHGEKMSPVCVEPKAKVLFQFFDGWSTAES